MRFNDEEDGGVGAAQETHAEVGVPIFEHNQWTVEGEIERFGAFAQGAARKRGPARWLTVFLLAMMLFGLVAGLVRPFLR